MPRAALDGGGARSGEARGRFSGAGRDRGRGVVTERPSKQRDERGDGTAGGGSLPAVRKPVRVDPTKEKPYTAKFISERKAGMDPRHCNASPLRCHLGLTIYVLCVGRRMDVRGYAAR